MSAKATEWTQSKLAAELGMDRRTVGRKLTGLDPHRKTKRGEYYWLRDVLDHLVVQERGDDLDLHQEQAKLAEKRREKIELENSELRGELCRVSDIEHYWSEVLSNVKAKMRAIPHNTAHRVMAAGALSEALKILEDAVDECLSELSDTGIPSRSSGRGGAKGAGSASEADRLEVG